MIHVDDLILHLEDVEKLCRDYEDDLFYVINRIQQTKDTEIHKHYVYYDDIKQLSHEEQCYILVELALYVKTLFDNNVCISCIPNKDDPNGYILLFNKLNSN